MQDVNPEKQAHNEMRIKDLLGRPLQSTDPASAGLLMRVVELLAAIEYELMLARHERVSKNGGVG